MSTNTNNQNNQQNISQLKFCGVLPSRPLQNLFFYVCMLQVGVCLELKWDLAIHHKIMNTIHFLQY